MRSLSPNILLRVKDLFASKNWDINADSGLQISLFDRFCDRLSLFDKEQQELLIELTMSFTRIGLNRYLEYFFLSFLCLPKSTLEKIFFLYPLVKPIIETAQFADSKRNYIEKGKTKSANFLHYMIETDDLSWVPNEVIIDSSFSRLEKEFKTGECILVLVDDYVGSGKTAVSVCDTFITKSNIQPSDIKIVCIAAHNHGIEHVKSTLGIEVFADIKLFKGITENSNIANIENALYLMEKMETKLNCNPTYRFGFEKTESLITFMNKTPNNTFPVYWHETETKAAPFPRHKKYKGNGK